MTFRQTFDLWNELGPEEFVKLLEGRVAHCCYGCGQKRPSSAGLAFFEYHGPGGEGSEYCAECGFTEGCHLEINPATGRPGHKRDHEFVARGPAAEDVFYCGCKGWD